MASDIGVIGFYLAVFASLFTVLSFAYVTIARIVQLEYRVNTMWDFLLKRGKLEAVFSGIGEMNSPVVIKDEYKAWISGELKDDLQRFAGTHPKPFDERVFILDIEHQFGNRLMKEVCIPHSIYMGSCLFIASMVAQENLVQK